MNTVLILGAGINGAAVARDLALNGIPVCVVDRADLAFGATSRSSRLIHGGLRYLEYRDIRLVRESLAERDELLRTAPQFVSPLTLSIPVSRRTGGLWPGFLRFSGLSRIRLGQWLMPATARRRGSLAVRIGLAMYDWLARKSLAASDTKLRRHDVRRLDASSDLPSFDRSQFRWVCRYSDAQILWPERFVVALLRDGQSAARQAGVSFEVLPYHSAQVSGGVARIEPVYSGVVSELKVSLVINATGASGDRTLHELGCPDARLFAGTKGSHLFTTYSPLKDALRGQGIYAEADDGRLVFILPCGVGVLIGTTDDPFDGAPESAVATEEDIAYLLRLVNEILPGVGLRRGQIEMHHAGVRPLPRTMDANTSAIPRGHSITECETGGVKCLTLIGGKLTTCRALAEEVADRVLAELNCRRSASTQGRAIPGCEIEDCVGTGVSLELVRWSLQNEWVTRLSDLVERRLMLVFAPEICRSTLHALADEMERAGLLSSENRAAEIDACVERLRNLYGRDVLPVD